MASSLLDKRETRIRSMFADIARSYDLLNHLLSLNIDRYWRWRTTRLAPPIGDGPILDVCTGTGDLALAYDKAARGRVPIFGSDFCMPMLLPARDKSRRRGAPDRLHRVAGERDGVPRRRAAGGEAARPRADGGKVVSADIWDRDALHWDKGGQRTCSVNSG